MGVHINRFAPAIHTQHGGLVNQGDMAHSIWRVQDYSSDHIPAVYCAVNSITP